MTERDECITCYERDEDRCYDPMCLRTGCRLQNAALRSAARTGPDVAGFEACRDALKDSLELLRGPVSGDYSFIEERKSEIARIDAVVARMLATAGESVTVEELINDFCLPRMVCRALLKKYTITRKSEARS